MTGAASAAVPEGFVPMPAGGGFMQVNGPLYIRRQAGAIQLGFRVEARHVNPLSILHGGMMASFCDMLLPMVAIRTVEALSQRFLPTISLQLDYLAPSPLGSWVQGETQVLRTTRSMVFAQGLVTADGVPVARCSGILKIGPPFEGRLPPTEPAPG
jgi:uncharacterized protein (TIGR00369 family)